MDPELVQRVMVDPRAGGYMARKGKTVRALWTPRDDSQFGARVEELIAGLNAGDLTAEV